MILKVVNSTASPAEATIQIQNAQPARQGTQIVLAGASYRTRTRSTIQLAWPLR